MIFDYIVVNIYVTVSDHNNYFFLKYKDKINYITRYIFNPNEFFFYENKLILPTLGEKIS